MKKYSHIIILALSLVFCSCSYEYEMPDYSNAVTFYGKTEMEKGIENKIREEFSKYGINAIKIDIQEEHAIEKEANGNILYDGDARGRVNIRSKTLDLSYAVNHEVKCGGGKYQPVIAYYQRAFKIEVSPFDVMASVSNEMFQIPYRVYMVTRQQSFNKMIIDKAQELSYEFADVITYVSERDNERTDLLRYKYDSSDGMIATQIGAESIVVDIEIYGWPKDEYRVYYDKKQKIGTYIYKFTLDEISNIFDITAETQYDFIEEQRTFYNVKNSLPMVSKANELGFEFSSWKLFVIEKDSDGNVLTRFEHESKDGKIEAQEDAKSIDVEVEIFGWPKEDGRVNYNKKQKIGTFVIKDIMLSEIKNSTLELTDEMQYEFVRHE